MNLSPAGREARTFHAAKNDADLKSYVAKVLAEFMPGVVRAWTVPELSRNREGCDVYALTDGKCRARVDAKGAYARRAMEGDELRLPVELLTGIAPSCPEGKPGYALKQSRTHWFAYVYGQTSTMLIVDAVDLRRAAWGQSAAWREGFSALTFRVPTKGYFEDYDSEGLWLPRPVLDATGVSYTALLLEPSWNLAPDA